jgi:hypothetical protein
VDRVEAVQGLVEQPHEHHPPIRLGEQVGLSDVVDGGVLDQPAERPLGRGEVVEGVDAAGAEIERQDLALLGSSSSPIALRMVLLPASPGPIRQLIRSDGCQLRCATPRNRSITNDRMNI